MSARESIAVLPLGATEQHGPHLPSETDWIIAEAVAARAAASSGVPPVEVLPVEKIGYSVEHSHDPRTLSLTFEEAVHRWVGIGEALFSEGTRKLVMLNAHGGNSPLMTIVATELRMRLGMLVVATAWTRFGYPPGVVSHDEQALGIHGGFIETSVMLALRPDLVEMDVAFDFPSAQARFARDFTHLRAYGPHAFGWMMPDLSSAGAVGNAAAATAEAGEAILDHAVAGIVSLLADVARFDLALLKR